MKKCIMMIALLTLTGCGWWDRGVAYLVGYQIVCVRETKVQYIIFNTGASVLMDQDGKPMGCQP